MKRSYASSQRSSITRLPTPTRTRSFRFKRRRYRRKKLRGFKLKTRRAILAQFRFKFLHQRRKQRLGRFHTPK